MTNTRLGGQVVPEITNAEHAKVGDNEIGAKKVIVLDKDGNQEGLSTAAKQDEIVAELGKKADKSTTPIVYNLTLANANTEYSQELPAHTKELRFRCRTLYDVRYAWVAGKVANPTTPYLTLPAGCDYWSDRNDLSSRTLYFASSTAGVVIEMEVFT